MLNLLYGHSKVALHSAVLLCMMHVCPTREALADWAFAGVELLSCCDWLGLIHSALGHTGMPLVRTWYCATSELCNLSLAQGVQEQSHKRQQFQALLRVVYCSSHRQLYTAERRLALACAHSSIAFLGLCS